MNAQRPDGNRVNRRSVIKGMVGGAVAAGWSVTESRAENAPRATAIHTRPAGADAQDNESRLIWRLDRPKPALPSSYFWTWDHSTNWVWDDPGMLNFGCYNRYLKQPGTYIEDYRRLTDLAAGLGVRGVLIWGFLRDSHGGIDSAKRVADYAASKGVAITPGVGTNWYGGVYYEGDHPYNIETFTRQYPDVRSMDENGKLRDNSICPTHPRFVEWLQAGMQWLFREFAVGGANLENGDYVVCYCPRCKAQKADWPGGEPDFWRHQYLGYNPALKAVQSQLKDKLVTWATYKGFAPGNAVPKKNMGAYMECDRPALVDKLPHEGVCQWTLTGMVRSDPLPLTRYLDDGAPKEAFVNDRWPAELKPPTHRSAGFIHQGSQWARPPRYEQVVSIIKEGCLRAYRAGLEGVSIHGEVASMHVPWALNYLAFSHFIHWPEDSLRDWGRKTLGQVLGTPQEGETFAELFAHWQAGSLSEAQRKDLGQRNGSLTREVAGGKSLTRWRFWNWLSRMASGSQDTQTAGIW